MDNVQILGQAAAEIQGLAQLDAWKGPAGRVRGHSSSNSDSSFRTRSNYVVLSGRYSLPGRKLSLYLAVLFFAASGPGQAATINAASPSRTDVAAAIAQVVDGDTVIIPAGTASWTSGITVSKGITIQGQTTTDAAAGTADDQTVIVDNLVHVGGDQGFFQCTAITSQSLRISGITFTGVGGRGDVMFNGAIRIGGGSHQVRIDHCHFISLKHSPSIQVNAGVYGVSDHNIWTNPSLQCFSHAFYNGTGFGDLEFSQPAGYGGPDFFFVEDCYINNPLGDFSANGGMDAQRGGKYVVRYCHLFNIEILNHGTEESRLRGGRAQELYNNDYYWSYETTMDGIRTGSLIAHDNNFTGVLPHGYGLQTYRGFHTYPGSPWLGASGANPWDVNVTEANGTHVDGHQPYLFESGTVTGGSENCGSGLEYLTDTSKTWTTNQWTGYTALKLSNNTIGYILSNTNNTLTMKFYDPPGNCPAIWRSGDQYQIHKYLIAMDQAGRGAGDLITGATPINSTTGTPAWPHQALEPCYSWNNIHSPGGQHMNFSPSGGPTSATLQAGRDYYQDTEMPGYTPYVYPHPLVSGEHGPEAPGNLRILP